MSFEEMYPTLRTQALYATMRYDPALSVVNTTHETSASSDAHLYMIYWSGWEPSFECPNDLHYRLLTADHYWYP
jgi:hypothetical protein